MLFSCILIQIRYFEDVINYIKSLVYLIQEIPKFNKEFKKLAKYINQKHESRFNSRESRPRKYRENILKKLLEEEIKDNDLDEATTKANLK